MDKLRKLIREEVENVLNERAVQVTGDHGNKIRISKQSYDPNRPEGELMIRMNDEVIYLNKSKAEELVDSIRTLLKRNPPY